MHAPKSLAPTGYTEDLRRAARAAFDAAVEAVDPSPATYTALCALEPLVQEGGRILVVSVGKAAVPMARSASHFGGGFLIAPDVTSGTALALPDFEISRGGHPVPTPTGFDASRRILDAVGLLGPTDVLLLLLSGGASSLFEVPVAGLSDAQLQALYQALLGSGFSIDEINAVRSSLSQVKGGRLAGAAAPASAITLAISDVVGDDPATIGSGPTVVARSELPVVRSLLDGIDLDASLRSAIDTALEASARAPSLSAPEGIYRLVATGRDAAEAARVRLASEGYTVFESPIDPLHGDADAVADAFVEFIRSKQGEVAAAGGAWCVVAAGETTVRLPTTAGDGGRNRHLACRVAAGLEDIEDCVFLAAGTDGVDGSTSAAGAIIDGTTAARMRSIGVSLQEALARFDTGSALAACGDDLVTGASETNVGDIVIALGGGGPSGRRGSR